MKPTEEATKLAIVKERLKGHLITDIAKKYNISNANVTKICQKYKENKDPSIHFPSKRY